MVPPDQLQHRDIGNKTHTGMGRGRGLGSWGECRDIVLKAEILMLVLYFPQTHDLLKDSALSATVVSHLKQGNDRLSEERKLFKGIVWI